MSIRRPASSSRTARQQLINAYGPPWLASCGGTQSQITVQVPAVNNQGRSVGCLMRSSPAIICSTGAAAIGNQPPPLIGVAPRWDGSHYHYPAGADGWTDAVRALIQDCWWNTDVYDSTEKLISGTEGPQPHQLNTTPTTAEPSEAARPPLTDGCWT